MMLSKTVIMGAVALAAGTVTDVDGLKLQAASEYLPSNVDRWYDRSLLGNTKTGRSAFRSVA